MNEYSEHVLEKLRGLKPAFKDMRITRMRVFGSVVRGEAKAGSDVDLLVDIERPMGFFEFSDIHLNLEDKLGIKVDLVTEPALHPALRDRILAEARDV